MMFVTKGKKITYVTRRASTLPDNRPDKNPNSGITDSFKAHIGTGSNFLTEVNVKYILDRTYDEKNSYYKKELDNLVVGTQVYNDYQSEHKDVLNGVFYPINHVNCSTKDNYKCVRYSKK